MEKETLVDVMFASISVSITSGAVLFLHLREHTWQGERLMEQNERLKQGPARQAGRPAEQRLGL